MAKNTSPAVHHVATFHIDVRPDGDDVHVVPVGELDLTSAAELQAQLRELRGASVQRVVLDLRELRFLDSQGIRVLLAEHHFAQVAGRQFSLISGPPSVQRTLEICGLVDYLPFQPA